MKKVVIKDSRGNLLIEIVDRGGRFEAKVANDIAKSISIWVRSDDGSKVVLR